METFVSPRGFIFYIDGNFMVRMPMSSTPHLLATLENKDEVLRHLSTNCYRTEKYVEAEYRGMMWEVLGGHTFCKGNMGDYDRIFGKNYPM